MTNGDLIAAAEAAEYDVLVTADKNIRHQQNLSEQRIGLVVLSTNLWPIIRQNLTDIVAAIDRAGRGCYIFVDLSRPALHRRSPPGRA